MKRSAFMTSVIWGIAAFSWSSTAVEEFDFGDSGIVVVVEADDNDDGKEYGVKYIPWLPDEFYVYHPSLPAAPSVPWPVAWDRDPPLPDPCQRALDQLSDIEEEIVWRQETIDWANENGFIFDAKGDGSQVFAGSERFDEVIRSLVSEIEDLREQRNEAADRAKSNCAPPGNS